MNQDFVVASQKDVEMHLSIFFGSDRSSRNANLCSSIRSPVRLAQSSQRAIREHSEHSVSNQRVLREQSRALKSESYSRSLKYCVLLSWPRSVSLGLRPPGVSRSGQWAVRVSGCVTNQRPGMMVSQQLPSQIRCQHRPSEAANTIPPWSHLPSHPWLISTTRHIPRPHVTCNLMCLLIFCRAVIKMMYWRHGNTRLLHTHRW